MKKNNKKAEKKLEAKWLYVINPIMGSILANYAFAIDNKIFSKTCYLTLYADQLFFLSITW